MGRGGKRSGAGRKVGSVTTKTREIAEQAIAEGKTPLDVMLGNMRFYDSEAEELARKLLADGMPEAAEGEDPGEAGHRLIEALKMILETRKRAGQAAQDAAPYLHARIAPGDGKGGAKDDEVPLAERLVAYQRADAIAASPNKVVELKRKAK